MSLQDTLPVGSIVLPVSLTTPAKDPWARHDLSAALAEATRRRTRQHTAMNTILGVVRRLVDTATFSLSAEDYATLDQALREYETSQ